MNIFNPEHDLCLANGDANFVPPRVALEFGKDCAGLTAWIEQSPDGEIVPWGWDSALKNRLLREGVSPSLLPSDKELDAIRRLSHRRMAVKAEQFVRDQVLAAGQNAMLRPEGDVLEVKSLGDAVAAVDRFHDAVMKAPISGSGRGIRWARSGELSKSDLGWCSRTIERQGSVIIEKRCGIVQESAMLFHIGASEVTFEGLSLFYSDNGAYKGNILGSDSWITEKLCGLLSKDAATMLPSIQDALKAFISKEFLGEYKGFVGVDMFIYRDEDGVCKIAPAVELNVRMTMGLLARRVFDNHLFFNQEQDKLILKPLDKSHIASDLHGTLDLSANTHGNESTEDLRDNAAHRPEAMMKPANGKHMMSGKYLMCVEYSPAEGVLLEKSRNAAASLTEVTSESKYAVLVYRRD